MFRHHRRYRRHKSKNGIAGRRCRCWWWQFEAMSVGPDWASWEGGAAKLRWSRRWVVSCSFCCFCCRVSINIMTAAIGGRMNCCCMETKHMDNVTVSFSKMPTEINNQQRRALLYSSLIGRISQYTYICMRSWAPSLVRHIAFHQLIHSRNIRHANRWKENFT